MEIPIYQIDAFTDKVFSGNPAAVCVLQAWPEDGLLQAIASENNLSETAFLVKNGKEWDLRWFTPAAEIDLCGHATLAAAHVVFSRLEPGLDRVVFQSRSGPLGVSGQGGSLFMDFPSRPPKELAAPSEELIRALCSGQAAPPLKTLAARDYLVVYRRQEEVEALSPDMEGLKKLDRFGIIATAPGRDVDFVSRFFAPGIGIPEDPVTGSAHCTLIPYWAGVLGKTELSARQVSARGGRLDCRLKGDRVEIGGRAAEYMRGVIEIA